MLKSTLLLLTGALLAGTARAQAPEATTQLLTRQLNQLMADPQPEERTEVLVSLADCGVRQTIRKYRAPNSSGSFHMSVGSSKNGSSWGAKTNDKVELELSLGLDWSEIGAVSYSLIPATPENPAHYELKLLRRPATNGPKPALDALTLPLYTTDEAKVDEVVRHLRTVQRQCTGTKG